MIQPEQKIEQPIASLPERRLFGDYAIDMSPFIQQERDGITVYKEGPLFQSDKDMSMPLANRQIVTVRDEQSGALVAFDIITKGFKPVRFDQKPQTTPIQPPAYLGERLQKLLLESQKLLRISQSTHQKPATLALRPESDYIFSTDGRNEWEESVMGKNPGIVLALRTTGRVAPGPGGAFLPKDLPDDATIQRAAMKVNKAFSLGVTNDMIAQIHAPEQKKTIQIGNFSMQEPERIQTPWSKDPLYLTTYTTIGQDGDTVALQTLTSQHPLSLINRAMTGTDSSDPINVGMERFCPCMRGRKGCDCYSQMEGRLETLFSDPSQLPKDNIYVFMPLDATMAYGEAWGDYEHSIRAQADGVLMTGQIPTTHNMEVRRVIVGPEGTLDRTNYQPAADLLTQLYRTDKRGFVLLSDNNQKVSALESIGKVTQVPTDIEGHPESSTLGVLYFSAKNGAGNYGYRRAIA